MSLPQRIQRFANHPNVKPALRFQSANQSKLIDLIIRIQQIPAPTFAEAVRADAVEKQMHKIGLLDVQQDAMHNVYGRIAGDSAESPLIVTAHSDTVFPAETDLTVRHDGSRIYGPGIADNSAGVAGVLTLAQTLLRFQLKPKHDIWVVINVGEEGLGDLGGMRGVTDRFADSAGGFIVVEGGMYGYLLHEAIGVRRYQIAVAAQGGHSWSDFGRTSAIHVLGHIIAEIDGIQVAPEPKTSYNVGVIEGGTSINTIASHAALQLDLRSESQDALTDLIDKVEKLVADTATRFGCDVSLTQIGNRPAGAIPRDSELVKSAEAALRHVGCLNVQYLRGSTDANIPLSRGLPAVVVGLAQCANAHRTDEYLDTTNLARGMRQLLLLTLAAADYEP